MHLPPGGIGRVTREFIILARSTVKFMVLWPRVVWHSRPIRRNRFDQCITLSGIAAPFREIACFEVWLGMK